MKFKAKQSDLLPEEEAILFKINEKFVSLKKSLQLAPIAKTKEDKDSSCFLEKIKVHQDRLS